MQKEASDKTESSELPPESPQIPQKCVVVRTGAPQRIHRVEIQDGQSGLKTALTFVRTGSPLPLECGWWLIEQ